MLLYLVQFFMPKPTFINIKSILLKTLHKLDDLDMKLLFELTRDGSISVPNLSKKMGINASVLYSRIKRLTKKKLIKKFTILVDESQLGIGVKATIGINRDPKLKDAIHKQLLQTAEIVSISEVTGRFDIMVSVHAENLHVYWFHLKNHPERVCQIYDCIQVDFHDSNATLYL